MERALSEWEQQVVQVMATATGPGSDVVRESVPHLVWTGECGCGCASFNVRDGRFPKQPHVLEHFSNGWTPDHSMGVVLWLGEDGRPLSIDIEAEDKDLRPDPATFVVERA